MVFAGRARKVVILHCCPVETVRRVELLRFGKYVCGVGVVVGTRDDVAVLVEQASAVPVINPDGMLYVTLTRPTQAGCS